MAFSIAGKTAIVTGAGSGISLAFARHLLSRQCNVLFADLALRPEAQELVKLHGRSTKLSSGRAVFQKTDVTRWSDLQDMFKAAREEFKGDLAVVCPGAGVYEPQWSSFWHPAKDSHPNGYTSLDINLVHPIRTTQLAIQQFLPLRKEDENQRLSIVHISSIAGQTTPFHAPLYNASKHGINGFVRTLAPLDQRFGIRVTAVAPGVIKTPLWTDNPDKMRLVGASDKWVGAEEVAEQMGNLATAQQISVTESDGKGGQSATTIDVEGGMIVEINAANKPRLVKQYMDLGPEGLEGNTVANVLAEREDILQQLSDGNY